MNDKIIGIGMLLSSLGITAFMFVWTLLLPILDPTFLYKAYIAVAVVIFIAVLVIMMLTAWIGWTLLKTRAPDTILEEIEEQSQDTSETEKQVETQ
ncbi:MAG: hypothetical protein ACTSYD_11720 [Candidatus Heimdallarchaeaceae archaeon]